MSSRRKFFLVFVFILIDAFLIIGFLYIRDATTINVLKKEVNNLSKLNIMTDNYNTPIKTSGKYAIVEGAIKEYLSNYAVGVQEVSNIVSDEKLTSILSYDNYVADGPNFDNSLAYLNTNKEDFNNKIDVLIDSINSENMKKYINSKTDDPYYRSLYIRLITSDDLTASLYPTKDLLTKTKVNVNNIYDTSIDVLNYLKVYQDSWTLEDGQVKFNSQDLYDHYMEKVSKINSE